MAVPGQLREDPQVTQVRQFYGGNGVPMTVPGRPEEVAAAWGSQRQRLRGWLAALTDDEWSGPTRCSEWGVLELAQHLTSGAQFLGYTLHQARKGEATRLLEGFDPQKTPGAAAAMFRGLSPPDLLEQMTAMDAAIGHELGSLADDGETSPAEAPLGQVPAHVSVNHFLFDSWVHERDLMLPANQVPVTEPNEAAMVASYVVALAGAANAISDDALRPVTLRMQLTDLDRQLNVEMADGATTVAFAASAEPANVTAKACDLVDFATGRAVDGDLAADQTAIDFLGRLAILMG
jgi:uncharacterized protein (TIGR03083 family)